VRLVDVAPRLAKARDQRVAQERAERAQRRRLRDRLTDEERVLAHRELQAVRALNTGSRRYMDERHRKLRTSARTVARLQAELATLEASALCNDPGADHWVNRYR
jgi:hypothetical protein